MSKFKKISRKLIHNKLYETEHWFYDSKLNETLHKFLANPTSKYRTAIDNIVDVLICCEPDKTGIQLYNEKPDKFQLYVFDNPFKNIRFFDITSSK